MRLFLLILTLIILGLIGYPIYLNYVVTNDDCLIKKAKSFLEERGYTYKLVGWEFGYKFYGYDNNRQYLSFPFLKEELEECGF